MLDFKDKICFVTGSRDRSGIGFAAASRLGELGGTVFLCDIKEEVMDRAEDLRKKGVPCEAYIGDLTEKETVQHIVRRIIGRSQRIDVLVNAAGWHIEGVEEEIALFAETSDQDWWRMFHRNLLTMYNVTRAVLPHMIQENYGRIVNVSSVIGVVLGSRVGDSAYCSSKAGIVGMSKAIALEVARDNITINSVLPGYIAVGTQPKATFQAGLQCPMGRNGTPQEVGDVIAFLASEEASYITGQTVTIDGGCSLENPY